MSGICDLEDPDLDYWAEMRLDDVRLLYVTVLHRDSTALFSKLNVFDLTIRGVQLRTSWTAAPYSIRLPCGREVEVQAILSQPEEWFLVYPIIFAEHSSSLRNQPIG